jgi:hypothetical protein
VSAELQVVQDVPKPEAWIVPLQPNNLFMFKQCEPYLRRALEHTDEWDIDDVALQYANAAVGLILCLTGENRPFGALCVEVGEYPKKRILQVHLFGADDHSEDLWAAWIWPQLQDFARSLNCTSIIGTGRDGWARKLGAKRRILWEVPL